MQAVERLHRQLLGALNVDKDQLRSWKERTCSREMLAEVALLACTGTVLGYVIWWATRAADSYRILGLG